MVFFLNNLLPAAILTVILCLAMTKRRGMGQSGATPAWDSARRKNRFNSAVQFVKMQPCLPAPEAVSCREWGVGFLQLDGNVSVALQAPEPR